MPSFYLVFNYPAFQGHLQVQLKSHCFKQKQPLYPCYRRNSLLLEELFLHLEHFFSVFLLSIFIMYGTVFIITLWFLDTFPFYFCFLFALILFPCFISLDLFSTVLSTNKISKAFYISIAFLFLAFLITSYGFLFLDFSSFLPILW